MPEKFPTPEDFHRAVRNQLRSIPVPPGLRERILAARQPTRIIPVNFRRRWLALAAALALVATGLLFLSPRTTEDRSFTGFQNRMSAFAVRQYSMDLSTHDLAEVRSYLARKGAPTDFNLSRPLQSAPVKGGAKLSWQGTPVTMVCFGGPGDKTLYLFVIDANVVQSSPEPAVQTVKGLTNVSWTERGKTYLLAADLPPPDLQRYL